MVVQDPLSRATSLLAVDDMPGVGHVAGLGLWAADVDPDRLGLIALLKFGRRCIQGR